MNLSRRPLPLSNAPNFPLVLAPMVGLSHVGLRLLVRRYWPQGAVSFFPTEMLNSRRLPGQPIGATPETQRSRNELDLVPQILGNEEEPIRRSVKLLEEWGAAGIDINMGCPVEKALKHNYGVALMGDPDYAAQVTEIAVRSARIPVSVKLRAGPQNNREFLSKFVRRLEEAGAAWLTLHPRTPEQKRRGRADWDQIRFVREQVRLPVIGNGDVQTAADVKRMLAETGCDGVMVGRALTARPWLPWQVGEDLGFAPPSGLEGRRAPRTPLEEGAEMGRGLRYFVQVMREYFPEKLGVRRTQFLIRTSAPWLTFGQHLFALMSRGETYAQLEDALEEFFAQEQTMVGSTELRS